VTYTYDKNGNLLTESIKPSNDPRTFLTTYTYDNNNRLLSLNREGDSSLYTYDARGNLILVTGHLADVGNFSTTYIYDDQNNVLTMLAIDAWGYEHKEIYSYEYDRNNILVKSIKTTLDGSRIESTYDRKGNIAHEVSYVIGANTDVDDYIYDKHGNLLSKIHNGLVEFAQTWIAIPH